MPTKTASGIPLWPSRDAIEEEGGMNLYEFVGNDGVGAVDFLGNMITAAQNEIFRSKIESAFEKVTGAGLYWEKIGQVTYQLCKDSEGDTKLWKTLDAYLPSNTKKIVIDFKPQTATGYPNTITIDPAYNGWLPHLKAHVTLSKGYIDPYGDKYRERTNPPQIEWKRVDDSSFPAVLWHEYAGHTVADGHNDHFSDRKENAWNYWDEGLKPANERDAQWGIKYDAAVKIENEAREVLGVLARAPWYYGYNNRPKD